MLALGLENDFHKYLEENTRKYPKTILKVPGQVEELEYVSPSEGNSGRYGHRRTDRRGNASYDRTPPGNRETSNLVTYEKRLKQLLRQVQLSNYWLLTNWSENQVLKKL